ncbi:hypothetical protein BJV77DRAFT_144345 [Russula vinacea]|nr:hypothetical protein BJV77DRAFT_144345 [Russula vinacea]
MTMLTSASSPLAPPSSMTPYRSTPPCIQSPPPPYSDSEAQHSRARLLKPSNRDMIVLARIPTLPRTHARAIPFPTSPLCSLHRTPRPAGRLSSVTRSASLRERDRDREKHRRATLPPRSLENNLCVMTRITSRPRHKPLVSSPFTRSSIASAPSETTCTIHTMLGRYHGMTLHDTLCARCHPEVTHRR